MELRSNGQNKNGRAVVEIRTEEQWSFINKKHSGHKDMRISGHIEWRSSGYISLWVRMVMKK